MKAIMTFVAALSVPLIILDTLGGIVSGIWLAVIGDWGIILLGIVLLVVPIMLFGIILMPGMGLSALSAYFASRGKTVGLIIFNILGNSYILAIVTVWCCGTLLIIMNTATQANFLPRLIWSYGIATGPWMYMAAKGDGDAGFASVVVVFLAQLAYLTLMFLVIFTAVTMMHVIVVFSAFMAVGLGIIVTSAVLLREEMMLGNAYKQNTSRCNSLIP